MQLGQRFVERLLLLVVPVAQRRDVRHHRGLLAGDLVEVGQLAEELVRAAALQQRVELGTRTELVRLRGDRTDPAHREVDLHLQRLDLGLQRGDLRLHRDLLLVYRVVLLDERFELAPRGVDLRLHLTRRGTRVGVPGDAGGGHDSDHDGRRKQH